MFKNVGQIVSQIVGFLFIESCVKVKDGESSRCSPLIEMIEFYTGFIWGEGLEAPNTL